MSVKLKELFFFYFFSLLDHKKNEIKSIKVFNLLKNKK